jgi:hypothetical protein
MRAPAIGRRASQLEEEHHPINIPLAIPGRRSIHPARGQAGVSKMITTIQKQNSNSKEQALAAFVQRKAEIDAMLSRLQALSDDHFNYSPEEIDWGHVGTLGYYAELLKRVTDSAFKEGEHAG